MFWSTFAVYNWVFWEAPQRGFDRPGIALARTWHRLPAWAEFTKEAPRSMPPWNDICNIFRNKFVGSYIRTMEWSHFAREFQFVVFQFVWLWLCLCLMLDFNQSKNSCPLAPAQLHILSKLWGSFNQLLLFGGILTLNVRYELLIVELFDQMSTWILGVDDICFQAHPVEVADAGDDKRMPVLCSPKTSKNQLTSYRL